MTRFPFRFEPRYRQAARPFGITPERAWVDVDADRIDVRFGPWRLRTALDNIKSVEITGPYRFIKTAGPARLGLTDLGLTFATNGDRGVLITFVKSLAAIEPLGVLRHPELTVTVEDVEGLARALTREDTST